MHMPKTVLDQYFVNLWTQTQSLAFDKYDFESAFANFESLRRLAQATKNAQVINKVERSIEDIKAFEQLTLQRPHPVRLRDAEDRQRFPSLVWNS